ncbi:hypothetical protein D3C80_1855130 [compost metagenome]
MCTVDPTTKLLFGPSHAVRIIVDNRWYIQLAFNTILKMMKWVMIGKGIIDAKMSVDETGHADSYSNNFVAL